MQHLLLIMVGGACGTGLRVLMVEALMLSTLWGILAVNTLGSLLAGVVFAAEPRWIPPHLMPLLITGFLGGFTTFSAFSMDSVLLLRAGAYGQALLYMLLSVALGLGGFALGFFATRAVS